MRVSPAAASRFLSAARRGVGAQPSFARRNHHVLSSLTTNIAASYQESYHGGYRSTGLNNMTMNGARGFSSDTKDENSKEKVERRTVAKDDVKEAEHFEFKAETRQLLDIVTHSLYTDKEVFLRELVSNASDACEKLRHVQAAGNSETGGSIIDPDVPLEIRIWTDEKAGILTIQDTGIGLTKEEMVINLGTIAKSGSKAFVQAMQNKQASDNSGGTVPLDASKGIIGKFGVGFYSAFMVGDSVQVTSRPAVEGSQLDHAPHVWTSTGLGTYDISILEEEEEEPPLVMDAEIVSEKSDDKKSDGGIKDITEDFLKSTEDLAAGPSKHQQRGSSVVIYLKEQSLEYSNEALIEKILKKYSNFVQFPILLNGKLVNTMDAIWAKPPKEVTDEEHTAFYKFIANAYDEPLDHIHFRADAPLEVKSLFYIPSFHSEKSGMGRMDPGVSLYSRKVLIEHKSADILPEWLRFIKGVVDSEDLPLAISREKSQDTALVKKLRRVLTRKIINHLSTMARKNSEKYKGEFWHEYGFFLKEGICQDYEFQEALSKLLYFETNKEPSGSISSLEEYVSRCTPNQKDIYFLCAPNRDLAMSSPYLEGFKDKEVLLVYSAIDDFVLTNLGTFQSRTFVNAEKGDLDLNTDDDGKDDESDDKGSPVKKLSGQEADEFCAWFKLAVEDKVDKVKLTNRLDSSPAVVTDHESGSLRRMMQMVDTSSPDMLPVTQELPKQTIEINPKHPIILGMNAMRQKEPEVAQVVAEQIFDNCLVAAGLLDDSRSMLPRLNDLLLCVIKEVGGDDADTKSNATKEATPSEKVEASPVEDAVPEFKEGDSTDTSDKKQ